MTLFVVTLGFEEKFAVRMITRHGLDAGDKLLLLMGPRTPQSERAAGFLRDFVQRYYGGEVQIEAVEVKVGPDFTKLLREVHQLVSSRASSGERVVFNLSGGMRLLCIAALEAATLLALSGAPVEVELETEDSQVLAQIPAPLLRLPAVYAALTGEKLEILGKLREGRKTAQELSEALRRDETTVRRHLKELEELGLAVSSGGRPRQHAITTLGELMLSALRPGG